MLNRLSGLIEDRFDIETKQTYRILRRSLVIFAALCFAVISTIIVGFDDIFVGLNSVSSLSIGSVPSENVIAREDSTFTSEILTNQERENARAQVPSFFDPPDPNVARQQTQLTQQIIEFIDNVRNDSYATLDQQITDINQITALTLSEDTIRNLLELTDDRWSTVRSELITVLERVMRQSIRESELQNFRDQLPTQVSVRLSQPESQIVTDITNDVIRSNTFENPEKTLTAQTEAANAIEPQQRRFIVGQTVAPANQPIDNLSYEALQQLGLLIQDGNRNLRILRAFVASTLVMVLAGLYISRFEPQLFSSDTTTMTLIAVLFLIGLMVARAFGIESNIYLFPAATLGILYVAITSPNLAIVAIMGFAFLGGLMSRNSLEIATFIAAGNLSAILTLRDAGRLNNFFISGGVVGIINMAVVTIFTLLVGSNNIEFSNLLASLIGGVIIVPTTSFAGMYALTVLLNLPTPFKLIDLAQPSKPLLQRLLREAPGTYQHSLQVANLAEQAAEAIGADAQMTHVGALYHDIGKMSNPVFYTENQQHVDNPHDTLNDPYRSADIIINHAVEGDAIGRKYNLPNRIREFIREHHGTTQVFVFYQRAIERAGSKDAVDIGDFTYPGPIPQSKETAILMMADSCESAIRAIKPQSNKEITEVVRKIIDGKRIGGQLDASGLTFNELRKIEETFIDIFKGLFHPRIDYEKAVQPRQPKARRETTPSKTTTSEQQETKPTRKAPSTSDNQKAIEQAKTATSTTENLRPPQSDKTSTTTLPVTADAATIQSIIDDDDPLSEVPPLPKRNGTRSTQEIESVESESNLDKES